MIVKRSFNPVRVLGYIWREVLFALLWSLLIWGLAAGANVQASLPFVPVGILGSALAIFVAFRNNSAYGRWWEARTIWGALVNYSRVFARMVINFVDSEKDQADPEQKESFEAYKQEMVYRHIAFVHALRLHLRKEADHTVCQPFLAEAEYEALQQKQNKPNYLTQMTGDRVRAGQGEGFLQWFHSFQIEGVLTQFANHQGASERIKNPPLPRQYEVFTRLFVYLFAILLPMGLLSLIPAPQTWIIIPLATSIAGVFTIMEKTGAANENPFENRITDVPLTALCTIIERDLREMLGETDLPARSEATNGYLY